MIWLNHISQYCVTKHSISTSECYISWQSLLLRVICTLLRCKLMYAKRTAAVSIFITGNSCQFPRKCMLYSENMIYALQYYIPNYIHTFAYWCNCIMIETQKMQCGAYFVFEVNFLKIYIIRVYLLKDNKKSHIMP